MDKRDPRSDVSNAYAGFLEKSLSKSGGCCGSGSGCCSTAALAGYEAETARYTDASGSSFGCGNPLAFAGVEHGQTVLDLGAGAGFDLLIASDKVGPEGLVIGVDMTDAMLDAAQKNIDRAGKTNIELRKGYIEALPVEDSSVDWVISNCVINLSPDKQAVFLEIARVLRPGGRIAISDIVAENLPPLVRENSEAYYSCIGGAIAEGDYIDGLSAAGLEDVSVTERIVYTAEQLAAMLRDESFRISDKRVAHETAQAAGSIWSARFTARKP